MSDTDARWRRTGWTRVIVEKPFGRDSESFRQLSADLYEHLTEDQMFRIDHYLGKELIENLTVRCPRETQSAARGSTGAYVHCCGQRAPLCCRVHASCSSSPRHVSKYLPKVQVLEERQANLCILMHNLPN